MKIGLKEWIIDILGGILIIVAIVLVAMKQIDTKTFLIMLVSGILMVSWTVKKFSSFGFSTLKKYFNKKLG
jgi:hypothetical protein